MGQAFRRATGRIRSVKLSQPTKTTKPLGSTDEQKISRVSQYENLEHGKLFPFQISEIGFPPPPFILIFLCALMGVIELNFFWV